MRLIKIAKSPSAVKPEEADLSQYRDYVSAIARQSATGADLWLAYMCSTMPGSLCSAMPKFDLPKARPSRYMWGLVRVVIRMTQLQILNLSLSRGKSLG